MKRLKYLGWYEYRKYTIVRKYGGWVVDSEFSIYGDRQLYKTLADAKNAIDKREDSTHKAEPRVIRKLTDDEFYNLYRE